MIGRLVWVLSLSLVAVITIGVQFDRESERNPALAQTVPGLFRSSAQPVIATSAIASDDAQKGLEEARKLVRRRPIPAEHLRILSQAQLEAGEVARGALTIQYAAQRGWRDGISQEAMLRFALQAGDMAEAARRYTALFLRRGTNDEQLEAVGGDILGDPGGRGRATFSAIIIGSDRWHGRFLRRGARVLPPDAFLEVFEGIVASGGEFDCNALRYSDNILRSRGTLDNGVLAATIEERC